jgi:hypothetical protein
MGDVRLKSLVSRLQKAKTEALIPSGRAYDPSAGDWLQNAVAQQEVAPFHAIIAEQNPAGRPDVVVVDDADETHPLMVSPHTWDGSGRRWRPQCDRFCGQQRRCFLSIGSSILGKLHIRKR